MGLLSPIFDPTWRERLIEQSRITSSPQRWRERVVEYIRENPQANWVHELSDTIH